MGLGAWASIGVGVGEYEEGKAKLEALEAKGRPKYQIPDEIYQNLSHAQRMALEGLPEEQKKQYVENIQAGTQLGLEASGTRQGGLAGISDLYAGQVEAYRSLLAQEFTARQANQQQLIDQRGIVAGQEAQQFQINELQPYIEQLQLALGQKQYGMDTWQAGMQQENEDIESMMSMMMGGMCWVAEELYGKTDIKTYMARFYANTTDNWFTRLYSEFGKGWAKFLRDNPFLKPLVRPIWDYMVKRGKAKLVNF